MRLLQEKYNPIAASVKPLEGNARGGIGDVADLFPDIYPLFRDLRIRAIGRSVPVRS